MVSSVRGTKLLPMPECRYCESQFEAEQSLRQHLYWSHERDELGRIDRKRVEQFLANARSENDSPVDIESLESFLSDADRSEMLPALTEFNTWLNRSYTYDDREACRELFWEYYQRVTEQCDTVVQDDGWTALSPVIDEFTPSNSQKAPLVTPVIANVTSRFVIRTRAGESVNAIPTAALTYLGELPEYAGLLKAEIHAESSLYGWGIGHESVAIADRIFEVATEDIQWAHSALFEAFWADQHEAVALLERLTTASAVPRPRFFIGCVGLIDDYARTPEDSHPSHPRYWSTNNQFTGNFTWNRAVASQIQQLVSTLASESNTPSEWPNTDEDWTFDELRI